MEWEFHLVFLFPKGKWEQSKEFPARKWEKCFKKFGQVLRADDQAPN